MISKPSERNDPAFSFLVRQVPPNSQLLSFFFRHVRPRLSPLSLRLEDRKPVATAGIYIYIRVEVGGGWRPVVTAGRSIYKYIRGGGGRLGKWSFHVSNAIQQSAATNRVNSAGLPSSIRLRCTRTLHLRIHTRRRLLAR